MSGIIIPGIVAILVIWLIYRIKNSLRRIIQNEIYKNFPSIKNTIDSFEQRLNYLKIQIEALEHKINELQSKAPK